MTNTMSITENFVTLEAECGNVWPAGACMAATGLRTVPICGPGTDG